MTQLPDWLPKLILFSEYGNEWGKYEIALYTFFCQDFVDSKPVFQGTKVSVKRFPLTKGKEVTFWHLLSEGDVEEDRLPDLRRCERIRWPRPIIDNSDDQTCGIKIWENTRRGEKRICIWLEQHDYLVVLAKRNNYVLFWTAYPVVQSHRKKKLQKEYEEYQKS